MKTTYSLIGIALTFLLLIAALPAQNVRIVIPHSIHQTPMWRVASVSQDPNPAIKGQPVTVKWDIAASAGYHIDRYNQGDPAPAPVAMPDWGIIGFGPIQGVSSTILREELFTAGNALLIADKARLGSPYYWDPCDYPPSFHIEGAVGFLTYNCVLGPAPPNEVHHHGDPDPLGGITGGGGNDDGSHEPRPRPDQGEVDLPGEIVDSQSIVHDPDRGSVPTHSDAYVIIKQADPVVPGAIGNNDVALAVEHRIVTINSPARRDLIGKLKLDIEPGTVSSDYVIFRNDPLTGTPQQIALPFEMDIKEPGHEGGGVHDWHCGSERFTFRRTGTGALKVNCSVTPTQGAVFKTASLHLLPVEVAVDADRDGEITFDGKDKTTAEKPFRFWINNDQDNLEVDEPNVVTYPDSERTSIYTKRDLEDYCRLSFRTGISITYLQNRKIQIGLKFTDITSSTTPSIHVFPNQSAVGNLD
ncbi:MAG: hypothetical protein WCL71_13580, partial [Deltaproteobacteria bacterium]